MTPAVDTAPRLTTADAVRLARELYQLDATAEPLPSERDQNFLLRGGGGRRYVLKIANAREDPRILDLQDQALAHLAASDTGLVWPKLRPDGSGSAITLSDGHMVRLLTWVDGVCLAKVQPHRPELLASLGRALANVDLAFERFSHPAAHRELYWDLQQAATARPHLALLPEPRRVLVEPFLDACIGVDFARLPQSVIYNDANDYNVLVAADGSRVTAFLDFGDMVHSATVCDLAIALAYAMLDKVDPIAAAAQIVAAYQAVRPLTEGETQALYPLAAGRLAMSVCYAAWQLGQAPGNEYLNISNRPAWALLEHLARLPEGWPEEVFRRACAGEKRDLLADRRKHLGPSLSISYSQPLHIIRGWRQNLYDAGGREYLDCVNNVAHVGHCHPRVTRAAAKQSELLNTNTRYLHEYLNEYLERLTATLPEPLRVAYLVCSGSEANELALRLARAHTGRRGVIVVDTAYHGNTNALVEISPYKFNGPGGAGKPDYVEVAPMPDVYRGLYRGPDAGSQYARHVAEAARSGETAAFFCESALGCGGQVVPPPGFLREAFEAVRAAGGVCIADEVQTGFGRAGSHFWMFEQHGVVPDIVTMGKPIGNGHPIGAVVTTPEIARSFASGMEYFNTFGGNPVSCAVGLAVLDVIRDEALQQNALETGDYLRRALREISHALIGDVRGSGLFLGIELVRDPQSREPADREAAEVVNRMKERGVLLSTDGPFHNVIKIKPPLVFSRADADRLANQLGELLPIALTPES
jgi:4-aminobutyrate aminotransferase-like enzyme/Ser/Thr protein kinase RdoA (MazF antagonist)